MSKGEFKKRIVQRVKLSTKNWEAGISDGLTLSCEICGIMPRFDYTVDDSFGQKTVEEKDRLGVICLSCLDRLAISKGLDVSKHLKDVQFIGIGKTIVLVPTKVFLYYCRDQGSLGSKETQKK
jgi:hypothetical protein